MGLRFEYPADFEEIWKRHPVGVKKLGYDAWRKLKLTPAENVELCEYLERRHRDDVKWLEGTFVPHLSSFLNGRRWEDDYKRVASRQRPTQGEGWRALGFASFDDYVAGRRTH